MKHKKQTIRIILIALCELLTVGNIIGFLPEKEYDRLLLAFLTLVLILIPELVERITHYRISQPMYMICVLYAIGPMLGHCNNLYYLIPWWDKLLHITGGVMFAFLGLIVFEFLGGDKQKWLLCCVFALLFSVALSVLWEFYEFGSDTLFGMDTQDDTVIQSIHSHLLAEELGEIGDIENITDVSINGVSLGLGGYLDIGLIDTMMDMILEALGAVITTVILFIDKNRHPVFTRKEKAISC